MLSAMKLLDRGIEHRIREAWASVAIVTLEGPRASGKTTLARLIAQGDNFVDLSDSDERGRALESVRAWTESLPVPSVIDEAQLVPELSISVLRDAGDEGTKFEDVCPQFHALPAILYSPQKSQKFAQALQTGSQ